MDDLYYYFSNYYNNKLIEAISSKDTKTIDLLNKKFIHTFRVIDNIKYICFHENMDSKIVFLAEISALFHDIGRFEQILKYETFNDAKSIDHAELSKNLFLSLTLNNSLDLLLNKTDIKIIADAIYHHNKIHYPVDISSETLTIIKLLKDADKLNILSINLKSNFYKFDGTLSKDEIINIDCIKAISNKKIINNKHVYTELDNKLKMISWIFDFNYKTTFNIFLKEEFLEILTDTKEIKVENNKFILLDIKNISCKHIYKKIKDYN